MFRCHACDAGLDITRDGAIVTTADGDAACDFTPDGEHLPLLAV